MKCRMRPLAFLLGLATLCGVTAALQLASVARAQAPDASTAPEAPNGTGPEAPAGKAPEAPKGDVETRLTALENAAAKALATVDVGLVFDQDKLLLAEQEKIARSRVSSENTIRQKYESRLQDIVTKLRAETVGSNQWRILNTQMLDTQLDQLSDIKNIEEGLRSQSDTMAVNFWRRLQDAVAAVCAREGYRVVLARHYANTEPDTAGGVRELLRREAVIYVADGGVDITGEVLNEVNKNAPAGSEGNGGGAPGGNGAGAQGG